VTEDLRYPIGQFDTAARPSPDDVVRWIREIEETPERLREAVAGLTADQLDTPYRPGGWTVRQVVHHVPDSHMNAYVRMKLALTEDEPVIKPYDEEGWAELEDTRTTPLEVSLALVDALHHRWVRLLRSLGPEEFARAFRHPATGMRVPLDMAAGMYAWHGRHHVAHVTALRERMGWR